VFAPVKSRGASALLGTVESGFGKQSRRGSKQCHTFTGRDWEKGDG